MDRRKMLALLGGSMTAALAGCGGGDGDDNESNNDTDNESNTTNDTNDSTGNETSGEASFAVSGLDPQSAEIQAGANLTVTATVENTGSASGTATVGLSVGGSSVTSEDVSLNAGGTQEVSFENVNTAPLGLSPGEFDHVVSAGDASASGTLTVLSPASFQVSGLSPQSTEISQGGTLSEVSATVENTGGATGTATVELSVGDQTQTKEVEVPGGGSETVTFSNVDTSGLSPGTVDYSLSAGESEVTGSVTITELEANFGLSNLSPMEAQITAGDPLTVSVDVQNTGQSEGTAPVSLTVGSLSTDESVTLAPGASETVTFENVGTGALSPGTLEHTVTVGSESVSGSLTVQSGKALTDAFRAESQGGYLAIGEASEGAAKANGFDLPPSERIENPIVVEADINDDGTWESTNVEFPPLPPEAILSQADTDLITAEDVEIDVITPDGFTGTLDQEEGVLTVDGLIRLEATLFGRTTLPVEIDLQSTTGQSGALTGSLDLDSEPVQATVVDNQLSIPEVERTSVASIINDQLGLPSPAGQTWASIDFVLEEQDQ